MNDHDGEFQYDFDLDKLTVGDYIFLASIQQHAPLDEEFARRAFVMLGHVLVDADSIPADELSNVMAQFMDAMLTRVQTGVDFSRFLDDLEKGYADDSPDRS